MSLLPGMTSDPQALTSHTEIINITFLMRKGTKYEHMLNLATFVSRTLSYCPQKDVFSLGTVSSPRDKPHPHQLVRRPPL